MNILKIMGCSVGLLVAVGTANAEDVKMFSGKAPTAEEMGAILFSNQPAAKAKPTVKMRSISFGKAKSTTPKELPAMTEQPQQVAAAAAAAASIGLPIKFAYNSAKVLDESKYSLNEIGRMLALPSYASERIIIEGHTDAGGSEGYNQYLSEKRAQSVKKYLRSQFNIASNRLLTVGMGESQSLPGVDPFAGANRRVQLRRAP